MLRYAKCSANSSLGITMLLQNSLGFFKGSTKETISVFLWKIMVYFNHFFAKDTTLDRPLSQVSFDAWLIHKLVLRSGLSNNKIILQYKDSTGCFFTLFNVQRNRSGSLGAAYKEMDGGSRLLHSIVAFFNDDHSIDFKLIPYMHHPGSANIHYIH